MCTNLFYRSCANGLIAKGENNEREREGEKKQTAQKICEWNIQFWIWLRCLYNKYEITSADEGIEQM